MHDDDPFDRDAILARRAVLLSSALALLHCSPAPTANVTTAPSADERPSATVVASTPAPTASASAGPTPESVTSLPGGKTWEEVSASAPPFPTGARLSTEERAIFEGMNKAMKARHDDVRAVWEAAKGLCDAARPECRPAWRAVGERLKAAHDSLRSSGRSLCGGGDNPPSIGASREEHLAFLGARLGEAEKHLGQIAAQLGTHSEQEWLKQVANANVVPPMPCLSCSAPNGWPIRTMVLFAAGSSAIDPTAEASLERVKEEAKQQLAALERLEIRGHADPQERDGEKLSLARAQAVHAWLAKNGLKDAKLVVVALGPDLPVSASAGRNQRVEFVIKGKGRP